MHYNQNSNSSVLIMYPPGAGGKFLTNCLALSNQAYLQHKDLIRQQLDGNLSPVDKLNYLESVLNLHAITKSWNDFDVGERQMYFGNRWSGPDPTPEIVAISNGPGLFFHGCHDMEVYQQSNVLWPNSKKIYFTNTKNFIAWRRFGHSKNRVSFSQTDTDFFLSMPDIILWDTDNFLDHNKFIENLKLLYDTLCLDDFDEELNSRFYKIYIKTLEKLKK